jgi:hypothetical protein
MESGGEGEGGRGELSQRKSYEREEGIVVVNRRAIGQA